jgi:DNA-directed RNA polymerase beta subunit
MSLDVLEKYLQQPFAITRHHIDSYEQCVFDEIPSIIHSTNPLVFLKEQIADGVFAYRVEIFIGGDVQRPEDLAISVSPPVVVLDGGQTVRRMFPNEARLRNLTYYAQFNADILIRITFTRRDEALSFAFPFFCDPSCAPPASPIRSDYVKWVNATMTMAAISSLAEPKRC